MYQVVRRAVVCAGPRLGTFKGPFNSFSGERLVSFVIATSPFGSLAPPFLNPADIRLSPHRFICFVTRRAPVFGLGCSKLGTKATTRMNTNVAIIGSTGQNAAAWTDAFIAAGFTIRNLVRFPEQLVHRAGRHSARLDLDDSSTFQPALKGIHTLGLITPSHPDQVKREVGLIYAAKQAGVRRIIKLSVIGADFVCPISAFARWHANVEDVLRTSGVAHVILRPNFFMQNTLLQKASIEAGIYAEPIATGSISYVDVRDVADVAVAVSRGSLDDQALSLTGREAIGGERVSALLSQVTGKRVRFVSPDLQSFRSALADGKVPDWHIDALAELYSRVQAGRASHVSSITCDIENLTGKRPRSFLEFARDAFDARGGRRRSARPTAARRVSGHLFNHDLSRDPDWPVGFRL